MTNSTTTTKQVMYVAGVIVFAVILLALYSVITKPDHGDSSIYIDCPDLFPNAPSD